MEALKLSMSTMHVDYAGYTYKKSVLFEKLR